MIEIDYGKEAYVKLQQLDKYVKKLEAEQESCTYNELSFQLGGDTEVLETKKTLYVHAFKAGRYYFHINMRADLISLLGIMVKVYVNEVMCYSFICSLDVDYTFLVEPSLLKGENTIKVVMTANTAFNLDYLNVKVNGLLDYSIGYNRLSLLTASTKDYVAHFSKDMVEISTHKANGKLEFFRRIYDIKDACVVCSNTEYLYLAVINLNDTLCIKRINLSNLYMDEIPLNVSGVTSVTAHPYNTNSIKVYFCKLYNLYEGVFSIKNETFTYSNTNKKAVKVFGEANLKGCCVIKDRLNNCTFVVDGIVVANVVNGDKFHITKTENGYNLEFTDGNKLLSQEVVDGKTTEVKTIDYCDERMLLLGDDYVVRSRNVLSIK